MYQNIHRIEVRKKRREKKTLRASKNKQKGNETTKISNPRHNNHENLLPIPPPNPNPTPPVLVLVVADIGSGTSSVVVVETEDLEFNVFILQLYPLDEPRPSFNASICSNPFKFPPIFRAITSSSSSSLLLLEELSSSACRGCWSSHRTE